MLRLQLALALKEVSALPVLTLGKKKNKTKTPQKTHQPPPPPNKKTNNITTILAPHSCWEECTLRLTAVLLPAPNPHAHSSTEISPPAASTVDPKHQKHRQEHWVPVPWSPGRSAGSSPRRAAHGDTLHPKEYTHQRT